MVNLHRLFLLIWILSFCTQLNVPDVAMAAEDVIEEPPRQTPVIAQADVVVIGGGLGGVGAALAAARSGAKTILIERSGYPGGWLRGAGLGNVLAINGWRPRLDEGVLLEITRKVVELAAEGYPNVESAVKRGQLEVTNHEILPHAFQSMLVEAGMQILYFSTYAGSVVKDNRIQAVLIQTHVGRAAVRGKVFIDCTGLATVAAESGAPVRQQEALMGLACWIGPVDVPRYQAYEASLPKMPDPEARRWLESKIGVPVTTFEPRDPLPQGAMDYKWEAWLERQANVLGPKFREAVDRGEMPLLYRIGRQGRVGMVEGLKVGYSQVSGGVARPRTYIVGVDPTDIRQLTEAHIKSTQYLFKLAEFLRKHIPGFEKAQVLRIAEMTLNRAGRSITNDAGPDDFDDVERPTHHPDAIAILQRGPDKGAYEVPYSTMLPQGIQNLLAVGKSSSGGWMFRTHMLSVVMGQAAGTAAAIAVRDGVLPGQIDIAKLQAELRAAGVPIPQR